MPSRVFIASFIIALSCVLATAQEEKANSDQQPPKFMVMEPLEGRVVAPDGTPVVGAHVEVHNYVSHMDGGGFYLEEKPFEETTTDDSGRFVFDSLYRRNSPGETVVTAGFLLAEAEGYGPAGLPVVTLGRWLEVFELQLAEPADLALRVSPCRWRTILVSDVSELRRKVNLDRTCATRLIGLAAGRASVEVWTEEYGESTSSYVIDLKPNQLNEIDLALRLNSISGVVRANGTPQADVEILAERIEPGSLSAVFSRKSNADGEFTFFDLYPGRWRLWLADLDAGAKELDLSARQDARVEFELK